MNQSGLFLFLQSYPSKRPVPINLLPRSIRLLILTHKPILSSLGEASEKHLILGGVWALPLATAVIF